MNPTFDFWSYALGAVTAVAAFVLLASSLLPAEINDWREKLASKRRARDAARARLMAEAPRHGSRRRAWRTRRSAGRHCLNEDQDTRELSVEQVQAAIAAAMGEKAEVAA